MRSDTGGIDRAKLSAALLTSGRENSLKQLESIVHPLVTADRQQFLDNAEANGEWLVVLDVPLLFETMDAEARATLFDAIIVVSAPADVQRARVLAREGMSEEKLTAILARPVPDATARAAADWGIETGHPSLAPARAQLARCLASLAEQHSAAYDRWRTTASGGVARVLGVSFDLDDTLWPTWPPIKAASAELARAIDEQLPRMAAAGCGASDALRRSGVAAEAQPLLGHDFTELRRWRCSRKR